VPELVETRRQDRQREHEQDQARLVEGLMRRRS
jgi:hypothetical protein